MKNLFIAICIFLLTYNSSAQNKYTDSLQTILDNTTKPIERFDLLNKILENNDGNQDIFQESIIGVQLHRIAQQLNNDSLLAISLNVIGNFFSSKGEYPTALEYFFKAIPLAEKAKDKRRISSIYFDMSSVYFYLRNLAESFKYCRKGGDNLPDKSSAAYDNMARQFYQNMGKYYLKKNQPDSALVYIHDFEEVSRRLNSQAFEAMSLAQSGTAYEQLGDKEMAEVYFKRADALGQTFSFPPILYSISVRHIPYLINTNQMAQARLKALQLLRIGTQISNNSMKLSAAGFLKDIYNNLSQKDSAYFYLSMESALKDSLFSQTNINKIQALAFKEQLRIIEEEDKQVAEAQKRKQNIQFALIAFGIITFIILFLLFSRSVVANERLISFFGILGLLIVFEFINLLFHPWLASFTHESPVLMLLALVIIASLLIPLHHRLEKRIKERMTEKNKAIRLAAAKKTIEKLEKDKS